MRPFWCDTNEVEEFICEVQTTIEEERMKRLLKNAHVINEGSVEKADVLWKEIVSQRLQAQ